MSERLFLLDFQAGMEIGYREYNKSAHYLTNKQESLVEAAKALGLSYTSSITEYALTKIPGGTVSSGGTQ